MAAETTAETNWTKADLEAAVLDLTDAQLLGLLLRADPAVRRAHAERAAYTWDGEADRNLLEALAKRLAQGRVKAKTRS